MISATCILYQSIVFPVRNRTIGIFFDCTIQAFKIGTSIFIIQHIRQHTIGFIILAAITTTITRKRNALITIGAICYHISHRRAQWHQQHTQTDVFFRQTMGSQNMRKSGKLLCRIMPNLIVPFFLGSLFFPSIPHMIPICAIFVHIFF